MVASAIRVHRIPFSTNVERIALAAAYKGIEVEWVNHDPGDRAALIELSGQELVPVAEVEGEVISDSPLILERLERLAPDPSLYPGDDAWRARAVVFSEWFNQVWKAPPNAIAAERERPAAKRDEEAIAALRERTHSTLAVFEAMLDGGDHLLGDLFSIGDVLAFPFLKYAAIDVDPSDLDSFHPLLVECLRPAATPRVRAWIARVDAMPRA